MNVYSNDTTQSGLSVMHGLVVGDLAEEHSQPSRSPFGCSFHLCFETLTSIIFVVRHVSRMEILSLSLYPYRRTVYSLRNRYCAKVLTCNLENIGFGTTSSLSYHHFLRSTIITCSFFGE
jgi:hypothetical protein